MSSGATTERLLGQFRERADETPLGWSPDDRYGLFRKGWRRPDGSYGEDLFTFDTEMGHTRVVAHRDSEAEPPARWSPSGTRIAFVDRGLDPGLHVVSPDGHKRDRIAPEGDRPIMFIAWRPDKRALAVRRSADRTHSIELITLAGGEEITLVERAEELGIAFWLSDRLLGYHVRHEGVSWLEVVDIESWERRTFDLPDVANVHRVLGTAVDSSWVHEVRLSVDSTVVPGQTLVAEIELRRIDGGVVPPEEFEIDWESSDPTVLEVEDGRLKARSAGEATLAASIGGWRRTEAVVTVVPLQAQDLPTAFEEEWSEGLLRDQWSSFGEPAPYVTTTDAGGALVANGDYNHASGVGSLKSFDLTNGLTLEVDGFFRFTDGSGGWWGIGLVGVDPTIVLGAPEAWISVDVQGGRDQDLQVIGPSLRAQLYRHAHVGLRDAPGWHTFALQVDRDGTFSVLVDGVLYERRTLPVSADAMPDRVRVLLQGGRRDSLSTLHGSVRVYEGARYIESVSR